MSLSGSETPILTPDIPDNYAGKSDVPLQDPLPSWEASTVRVDSRTRLIPTAMPFRFFQLSPEQRPTLISLSPTIIKKLARIDKEGKLLITIPLSKK